MSNVNEPVEDDAVPQEAYDDAFAEIDRTVNPHAAPPIGLSFDEAVVPMGDSVLQHEPVHRSKTLDDLYIAHKEIGTGAKFLRIERKDPSTMNGVRINGFLEDINEKLPMNEFRDRFGGGIYYVHVMGQARGYDDDGQQNLKTLDTLRLVLPGNPKMPRYDGAQQNMTQQHYGYGQGGVLPHPEVEIARIKMEEQRERRQNEERLKLTELSLRQQQMPPNIFTHIEEAGEKRATEVRQAMEETLTRLKRDNDRLTTAVEQRDVLIQNLREQVLREQTENAAKLRERESEQVRDLRERHFQELQQLRTSNSEEQAKHERAHSEALQRMASERDRMISELNDRFSRDRVAYESMQQQERQRLTEDHQRRETQYTNEASRQQQLVRDQYESRLTELQRSYEGRLSDQSRSLEREMNALRDQTAREVMSIKSTEEGKVVISKEFANLQVGAYQGKIVSMEQELAAVRSQLAEAQRHLNKPVREQIRDAHELAAETGFGGKPEEEGDWKKQAFGMIREVIPEVAKHLGETRSANKNELAASQQQHMQRVMAARQQQQMQQNGQLQLPPGQQQMQHPVQQRARGYRMAMPGMETPPAWGSGPPTQFQAHGPPPPTAPVSVHVPPPPPSEPKPEQAPPAAAQEPAQPPVDLSATITEESMVEFATNLNLAIMTGSVTPQDFAAQFVERAGAEVVGKVVRQMKPDAIVDAIANTKDGAATAIVTREGRKFVAEMWKAAAELTGD